MSYKNLEPLNKLVKGYMVRKFKEDFHFMFIVIVAYTN